MKNLHIARRAVRVQPVKIEWCESLLMRVRALGREYPRCALRGVFLYVKLMGGFGVVLVLFNWCTGMERWFGPRGLGALAFAVMGGMALGFLWELGPRLIRVQRSMLYVEGAKIESWSVASIVAVRWERVSERVVRIEVDVEEGEGRTVIFGVGVGMAGRVVEGLRRDADAR